MFVEEILLTSFRLHVKLSCYRLFVIDHCRKVIETEVRCLAKKLMWKRKYLINLIVAIMTSSAIQLPDLVMQSSQGVSITSPVEGEVIAGVVEIIGTSEIAGFAQSELAFSNSIGSIDTWFPISKSSDSVEDDLIYSWDTTLITDGDYRLRLRVFSEDSSISEFVISIITIQNYTPTTVPSPSSTSVFLEPTATRLSPTETPVLIPTVLPKNPLALSTSDLAKSLIYGILIIFGLIGISSIYSRWQRK